MTDVERRFGGAMFAIYREAKNIGYTPSIFLRMLNEKGALQTARQLINASQPSDGYTRLWCQRRSKISPPGRSKTSPLNVMRYAVLGGGCPGSP